MTPLTNEDSLNDVPQTPAPKCDCLQDNSGTTLHQKWCSSVTPPPPIIRKLFQELASTVDARLTCIRRMSENNPNAVSSTVPMNENAYHLAADWSRKHREKIEHLCSFLPSGSGWDCATKLDYEHSTGEKIVLYGSYHHMNDGGYYDGWTDHSLTVRSSLIHGLSLSISGRNRNEIKDYLYEIFDYALRADIKWDNSKQQWELIR